MNDRGRTGSGSTLVATNAKHDRVPALAPVLGANRDGSATAESARGLLITVMGEFVLPEGRSAWTQTLIAAMEALGVRPKATRQALARMEKRGWLRRERIGRRTQWTLTDSFAGLLQDGASRIYSFGTAKPAWDKRWLVLSVSVPERDRSLRYRMAQGLNWAGFGSLGQGLWVNPWIERELMAVDLLENLGVDAVSFRSEMGELGSGVDLAEQAWDLPSLRQRYDNFLKLVDRIDAGVSGTTLGQTDAGLMATGRLTSLVHEWRRFPFLDPDLPTALLPPDWPGPLAAEQFARLRLSLSTAGRDWWADTELQ